MSDPEVSVDQPAEAPREPWKSQVTIAGHTIKFQVHGLAPKVVAALKHKFEHFVTDRFNIQLDLRVQCTLTQEDVTDKLIEITEDAPHVEIHLHGSFKAHDNVLRNEANAVLFKDESYGFDNLLRLLLSERLPRVGGGLFHAASVDFDRMGLLFPGKSDAGKTTLSKLCGYDRVLSDEISGVTRSMGDTRVLKKRAGREWLVHATPFWGDMGKGKRSGALKLRAICMLGGPGTPELERLEKAEAIQGLTACLLCYSDEQEAKERALDICDKLVDSLPVYSLTYSANDGFDSLRDLLSPILDADVH